MHVLLFAYIILHTIWLCYFTYPRVMKSLWESLAITCQLLYDRNIVISPHYHSYGYHMQHRTMCIAGRHRAFLYSLRSYVMKRMYE